MSNAIEMLKRHEGFRSKPYEDTVGVLTIGYGINLNEGITEFESAWLLKHRVGKIRTRLPMVIKFFNILSENRKNVIVDMAYNLGISGLLKFKRFLAAMERGDFDAAAKEMLDSLWAAQVGDSPGQRAYELAALMREG